MEIVDSHSLHRALKEARRLAAPGAANEVMVTARQLRGLSVEETAVLLVNDDPETRAAIFEAAAEARQQACERRVWLFAPLYISNFCCNECSYCAFRARHRSQERRVLSRTQITAEAQALAALGHKRAALVCGAVYPEGQGFGYVLNAIRAIYDANGGRGEIRELGINIPPLDLEEFRLLHDADIAGYELAQETYHREMYETVHMGGPKRDYDYRIAATHRAREAGIETVGIGVLLGLYDWHFELLGLVGHAQSLERDFGSGPATVSLSRLHPAPGSALTEHPPHAVTDNEFLRLIAILRLALPATGQILAHEEPPAVRAEALRLGITEISAGARCEPGAYASGAIDRQFQLGDHRPLDAALRELIELDFTPSFGTASAPGAEPAALATLEEYLIDFASPSTRAAGESLIERRLAGFTEEDSSRAGDLIRKVREGLRDVVS